MKCLSPLYAYDTGAKNRDTGGRHIRILPRRADLYDFKTLEERYGKGNVLALPCGKCLNCRINYSRTWALRCVCEASLYDENWFLTLTYDDEHYPGCAKKEDLQKFIKRLRKHHPGVRYFACCERGEYTKRYHFHLILFNLHLDKVKCLGKGPKGGYYYECQELVDLWNNGFIVLGDVNYTTCNYVAQYCLKKVYSDEASDEYVTMSLKPGIGTEYFRKNWRIIYECDKIYINNGGRYTSIPPRYFDKLMDRFHPELLEKVKDQRINAANVAVLDELIKYGFKYREEVLEIAASDALNKMKEKLHKRK